MWPLMLLLSAARLSAVPACPSSCVVCSRGAVVCHRLAHFIDPEDTTQALMLTEGSITSVQPASLSDLTNVSVLALSRNRISVLGQQSFRHLPLLHTLMLDHNFLSHRSLQGGALTNLTSLEVLALGHNLISMIEGGWFRGNKALRSLRLEGNLLTSLDSGSFPLNDLKYLENLDLSDNLIQHLGTNSFRGLVSLQTLDLSRNRLHSAPAEAFSYLSWLSNLNLDLNSWNCSCQLLELAAFLSTYIQHPDKTLYNGRRMVCVSADNPAVSTVLELSEANCVPSNRNITVQIQAAGSVAPVVYARDLALTAVISFIGGVGLTLLVVLICYKMSRWKKLKGDQRREKEEEGEKDAVGDHRDGVEKRRDSFLRPNVDVAWNRTLVATDPRMEYGGQQFLSKGDETDGCFQCPECNDRGQVGTRPNQMRWNESGRAGEKDVEKRRARMMVELERNGLGRLQWSLNSAHSDKFPSHGAINSKSWQDFGQTLETLKAHRGAAEDYTTVMEGKRQKTLHCRTCNRTSRSPEGAYFDVRDPTLLGKFSSEFEGKNKSVDPNRCGSVRNSEFRREARNLTFDVKRPTLELKDNYDVEVREEREQDAREGKSKVQQGRPVKVKLNLNPLKKSKVHPRRRADHGQSERGSPKKSRDQRKQDQDVEKRSGKKIKKSSDEYKAESSGKEERKDKREDGYRNQGDQDENLKPAAATGTPEQPAWSSASGQEHNLPAAPLQCHEAAGLSMATSQLASQLPRSISISDGNHGPNLSLLSPLVPSSLPLQEGNFLLNSTIHGSNPALNSELNLGLNQELISGLNQGLNPGLNQVLNRGRNPGQNQGLNQELNKGLNPELNQRLSIRQNQELSQGMYQGLNLPLNSGPNPGLDADFVPSSISVVETSLALSGSSGSVGGPADHTGPVVPNTHSAGGTANPAMSPALVGSPTTFPEGSPGFALASGPHTSAGQHTMLPAVQNFPTTVETLSVSHTRTEVEQHVPPPPGGLAVVGSGDNALATDEPVSGVLAAGTTEGSKSSAGAGLLQQEYLSEEGSSSPRRKLKLVIPEKASSRPPTALERKIR